VTWVALGEGNTLRLRQECSYLRAVTAELRPDGTVSELSLEGGFGAGEDEGRLSELARADLATVKRKQLEREQADREYLEQEPAFRGDRLLRVVSGPWQAPGSLVITWLGVFEDGVIVNCQVPAPDEAGPGAARFLGGPDPLPAIDLTDDLGTSYEIVDLGSIDYDEAVIRASLHFIPTVPADAAYLVARSSAGSVEFKLRD
jgi:hypothetical protein